MRIILTQRIPDPTVAYAFKEIVVEGDEKEKLVEELLKKNLEWKQQTQKLADSTTGGMSFTPEGLSGSLKSQPANQE